MRRPHIEVDTGTLHRVAIAIQANDYERARKEIQQFLKREPADPSSLMYMSLFCEIMGDLDEALKTILLAIVLEQHGDLAGLHYSLVARLLDKKGRKADAEQVLKNGWERCKKLYTLKTREMERKKYFDIYNRLTVDEK